IQMIYCETNKFLFSEQKLCHNVYLDKYDFIYTWIYDQFIWYMAKHMNIFPMINLGMGQNFYMTHAHVEYTIGSFLNLPWQPMVNFHITGIHHAWNLYNNNIYLALPNARIIESKKYIDAFLMTMFL
ncbi:hypothetical protein ACJX0J_005434, partial [Zea mays]